MGAEADLPLNWRAAKDSDGKEYYFNELTGETSWSWPESAEKKPVANSPPVAVISPTMSSDASEFAPASEQPLPMAMAPHSGKRSEGGGSSPLNATLGAGALPRVLIVMFCSIVVLIQSAIVSGRTVGDGAAEAYGISVGSVSVAFSAIFLGVAKFKSVTFSTWVLPHVRGDLTVSQVFALFLVAWWTPAVAILTFFSPFTATSNAYFASWAAFITSLLMLATSFARVQNAMRTVKVIGEDSNVKALAGIVISSAVVLFASLQFLGTSSPGEATFGMIIGLTSLVISVVAYYMVQRKKLGPPAKKALGGFFVLIWFLAAFILTFDDPFDVTGNGYFGTWFATLCSVSFAYQEFFGGEIPLGANLRRSFAFSPMDEPSAGSPVEYSVPHVHPAGSNLA